MFLFQIGMSIFIYLEWKQYQSSVEGNLRTWMIDEHELNIKKVKEIQVKVLVSLNRAKRRIGWGGPEGNI